MKLTAIVIATFALSVSCVARASGFEFCDFRAEVQEVTKQSGSVFELSVVITDASRARENGELSYTDCREYIDRSMQVTFVLYGTHLKPGDEISFFRSAVDGFSKDGSYVGTSVKAHLLEPRKASER